MINQQCNQAVNKSEEVNQNFMTKSKNSEKWMPLYWKTHLENIRLMRANESAPIDVMGCHKCANTSTIQKNRRFHVLVSLMLSSQTKDEITYHAMLRLTEKSLTPQSIVNTKLSVLEKILRPVSFYKNKAKFLHQTAKKLIEDYDSDIPNNVRELVTLPGVGPKIAHLCMAIAWNKITGIGVDVHVHRVCNRLMWVAKATGSPEHTRKALENWLPYSLWGEINQLLVGFGQTICTATKPKCKNCLNKNICQYVNTSMSSK